MEKMKKRKSLRFLGMNAGELCAVVALIGGPLGYLISAVERLDSKVDRIDHKFEVRFDSVDRQLGKVELRLDKVELRLDNLEIEVKKTTELLNNYLTWRFLYIHDPKRKNMEPRYDPTQKTLEFVDKNSTKGQ